MSKLREWQSHPSYTHDREVGALREAIGDADDVLVIGDYGTTLASMMAASYDTFDIITKDDGSTPDPVTQHYHVASYANLPSLDTYDAVIAAWLDWPRRPRQTVKAMKDALHDDGVAIVELPDETSEYCTVLETIRSDIKGTIFNERLLLLESLTTAFTVERFRLQTAYRFQTIDDLILYFNQHADHEWGRKLTRAEKDRLETIGKRLGYDDLKEQGIVLRGTT